MRKSWLIIFQTTTALFLTELIVILGVLKMFRGASFFETQAAQPLSASQFLAVFLVSTFLLLFLLKVLRRKIVFEVIFGLSIFLGIWALFELFFPEFALIAAAFSVALRYMFPFALLQNLVMIAGISGIATALGTAMPWSSMAVVLIALAVYDVIAVYGTRHMVTMFKGLLAQGVVFALIIPDHPRLLLKRMTKVIPGEGFFFLGSGDLALPALFVASATVHGLSYGLGAAVGATFGLLATDFLFQWGGRRPMPALPPIALGTLAGFFVVMLVK
ncbi:hypothetical protein HY477_00540 [Candidatus Uhrbacteria bacterium]|nr:hypothetical protein [Candidatus Uhrbacteria bacterium]